MTTDGFVRRSPDYSWVARHAEWFRSITPAVDATAVADAAGDGGVRVHNFHSMTPDSAARALDRIFRGRDLKAEALQLAAAQPVSVVKPVHNRVGFDQPSVEADGGGGSTDPLPSPPGPTKDDSKRAKTTSPAPTPEADPSAEPPAPGPTAPSTPSTTVPNSSLLDMPDTTGHVPGDTWSDTMLDDRPVTYSIPEGNGNNTVDLEITNPDGSIDRWRIARDENGGLQHWHDDADGHSSYASRPSPDDDWYLQSFTPGTATTGAPSREFTAEADLGWVSTPSYDAAGNHIGTDVGMLNRNGLYDNQFVDLDKNITFFRTVADDHGGYDSILVGQVDHTGHGWRTDKQNRRWEEYIDENGNPASRRYDPDTGYRSFIYRDGENTRSETIDSSGRIVESYLVSPDDVVLSSLTRRNGLLVKGSRNAQGAFEYTFRDENDQRRGRLIPLAGGGVRLYYDGYEVVELDAEGRETKRYNRIGDRSLTQWVGDEFGAALGRGAAGFAEGFGGLLGVNSVVNMVGTVAGYDLHLATQDEVLTGMKEIARTFYQATRHFQQVSVIELTRYKIGTQDLSTTWDNITPSFLNVLNEESKLLIGTDWSGFHDNPGGTLGTAGFGLATWFIPAKLPRVGRSLPNNGGTAAAVASVTAPRAGSLMSLSSNPPRNLFQHGQLPRGWQRKDLFADGTQHRPKGEGPAWRSTAAASIARGIDSFKRVPDKPVAGAAGYPSKVIDLVQSAVLNIIDSVSQFQPALAGVVRGSGHSLGADMAVASHLQGGLGGTVLNKTPGLPSTRRQWPRSGERLLEDGTTLRRAKIDRNKPEVPYTAGWTDGLPSPVLNLDGSWTIHLRNNPGWLTVDFEVKARYLQRLGNEGKLVKIDKVGKRSSRTESWRSAKERQIFYEAESQVAHDKLIAELDEQQIDHAHDLQLGGKDSHANMWAIDAVTNHGMGGQINSQLLKVAASGAKIRIKIIR